MSTTITPRAKPATRDAERTRTAILDAAELTFARDGLRGSRTEDIAEGSGVTKAMIHYYFGTKEQLYQAVLDRVFAVRVSGLDFATLRSLEPTQALAAFVDRLLDQMCERPHLGPLFALENIQNHGLYYTRSGGEIYRVLREIIERGVRAGSLRPVDPTHAAVVVMGSCVHYFNVEHNLRRLFPTQRGVGARQARAHAITAKDFVLAALLR